MNHNAPSPHRLGQPSVEPQSTPSTSEPSFWDESQIQAVIRHAGNAGRSPEEFFNRKWKKVLCHRHGS